MRSKAFKIENKIREPITFKKGLNVILGGGKAENSIGKSSALLAIDFIFGGSTYIKSDSVKKVGHHTILFTFEFENIPYYFARDTMYPDTIHICDVNYKITGKSYTQDEFVNWLKEMYGLDFVELKFRDTVGRFFRIYGKPNCDEKQPLKIRPQESMEKAIDILIKLFDKYKFIEGYKQNLAIHTEEQSAFREARKYKFVPSLVDGKKKYDANVLEIERLKLALEQLSLETDNEFSEEQIERENFRIDLKNKAYRLNNKIQQNNSKLSLLEINLETGLHPTEANLGKLIEYFPDANLRQLHEVEGFHQKLAIILNDEFVRERESLKAENIELENEVNKINIQMSELGVSTQLSPEFLDQYSRISGLIRELENQNEAYAKSTELREKKSRAKEALERSIQSTLIEIEEQINVIMKKLNNQLFDENHTAPVLEFKAYNSYSFHTPDDDGTGTNYKGMVLFDLAVLTLTQLPSIAHDSLIFKNIGLQTVDEIIKLYTHYEKQIFIAFDNEEAYHPNTAKIIYDNTRLKLGKNGHELYGMNWSTGENNSES